jgi:hypothetical protein
MPIIPDFLGVISIILIAVFIAAIMVMQVESYKNKK